MFVPWITFPLSFSPYPSFLQLLSFLPLLPLPGSILLASFMSALSFLSFPSFFPLRTSRYMRGPGKREGEQGDLTKSTLWWLAMMRSLRIMIVSMSNQSKTCDFLLKGEHNTLLCLPCLKRFSSSSSRYLSAHFLVSGAEKKKGVGTKGREWCNSTNSPPSTGFLPCTYVVQYTVYVCT